VQCAGPGSETFEVRLSPFLEILAGQGHFSRLDLHWQMRKTGNMPSKECLGKRTDEFQLLELESKD
jgi:hypothetical protein